MVRYGCLFFFVLAVLTPWVADAEPPPPVARYNGILRHKQLGRDQLAKLELITEKADDEELQIIGILTLYMGDFESDQYISYKFSRIRYHLLTGAVSFDTPERDVVLSSVRLTDKEMSAKILSSFGEEEMGELSLRRDGKAEPKSPLLESLGGIYHCGRDGSVLQLETFRSAEGKEHVGNPFGDYEIRGRLGRKSSHLTGLTVLDHITGGTYNVFKGKVSLWGKFVSSECRVDGDTVACEPCTYQRVPRDRAPALSPPAVKPVPASLAEPGSRTAIRGDTAAISGQYHGHLHHEANGQYQAVGLHLSVRPAEGPEITKVRLAGAARLYFGDSDSTEYLPFRFEETQVALETPQIVLKGPGDAIVAIQSIGEGKMRGVWFSSIFGRVGVFELQKGRMPDAPRDGSRIEPLKGDYVAKVSGSVNTLRLITGFGPAAASNPSSPLRIGGFLHTKYSAGFDRLMLRVGSFDFYTGRIALITTDDLLIVGKRTSGGELNLSWYLSGDFQVPFITHRAVYRRTE